MLSGEIIIFGTEKLPRKERVKLSRSLYGYIDKSFYNNYTYPRKGLLSKIPYLRPLGRRAVLVTRAKDAPTVIQLLEEHGAQIYTRRILLDQDDLENLEALERRQDEETQTQEDQ